MVAHSKTVSETSVSKKPEKSSNASPKKSTFQDAKKKVFEHYAETLKKLAQ